MNRTHARVIAIVAVALAIGSALLLTELARNRPSPPDATWTFVKALGVTLVFQVGLAWAPHARGRRKWLAALLMLPALSMYGGVSAEVASKLLRGFPARFDVAIVAIAGVISHVWVYWRLVGPAGIAGSPATERANGTPSA